LSCHKIFLECSWVVEDSALLWQVTIPTSNVCIVGVDPDCLRCSCCHQVWRPRCFSWRSWVVL
jgi:hypothetical protein